ncbi:MAG TPA: tetratricopeptide repeat protein [Candidatus Paceibacterota bacterium]|uniref:Uncharacterized protein n=1 Tax=Candidatus Ryanbacteria bacterium RIFCSPHIGHO2_01_FULL_45_22 TaxID=1802114 RepID=A0A1G2G1F1_9BACT|nr:MAG: hypothetical protein A2719_00010 [Candidatus Ryanbacteria bacterium RIFCSPHIGHO2_01_FULL_45_22]
MTKLRVASDALAYWAMLFAFGLLPFFFIPVPWASIAQSKVALMSVLLVLSALGWIVSRLIDGTFRVPATIIITVASLLPIAYLISVLVSGSTTLSLVGTGVEQDTLAAALIWFATLILAAAAFSGSAHRSVSALHALFIGGLILAVLQALHLFFPSALSLGGPLTGQTGNAFGSWHDLGILFGFFVFLGAAVLIKGGVEGNTRYLYLTVSTISLLLLIVANLFDVWVALGVVSLVFLLLELIKRRRTSGRFAIDFRAQKYLIALVLISVFFAFFGSYVNNVLPNPLKVANFEARPSWLGTFQISKQALVSPKTLLFGVGPNTFTKEWGLHKPIEINATPFWNADFSTGIGSIPTSFVTVGITGFLAWLSLLVALVWLAYKLAFREENSPLSRLVGPLVLGVLFLFAYYVLYVPGPALSIFAFLMLGLLLAVAATANLIPMQSFELKGDWTGRVRMLGIVAFGLIFVFAGAGVARALLSDLTLNRGIVVFNNTGDIEKASSLVSRSIAISPQNDRAQRSAVQLGLLHLQKLVATADPSDENAKKLLQETISKTIQHGLDAVSSGGSAYQNWLELAALYGQLAGANIEGAYDNARNAYSRAQIENPNNPFPYLQLAQLELLQNKTDAALQYLASAVELKPDFAAAYYLASQIYALNSDFQNAIPAATSAVQSASDDPLGWYNLGTIYYASGDYGGASAALEQALLRQPQYSNAMYVLALTYYKLDRTQDAIKIFEDLNKLNPNQEIVLQALLNLRRGEAPVPDEASAR